MSLLLQSRIKYGKNEFTISGPQLYSKVPVKMHCRYRGDGDPARFIFNGSTVEAIINNVIDHEKRGLTSIGNGEIQIRQIEHILSALYGMGYLSTDIELSYINPKKHETFIAPPVCFLNATDYALAIGRSFGPIHQKETPIVLGKAVRVDDPNSDSDPDPSFAIIAPLGVFAITVHINFKTFWGRQSVSCVVNRESYPREIGWARSFFSTPFPHRDEWPELKKRFPALLRERMEHSRSIMIDYDHEKWITPPYRDDEPARHKTLDFIGDLALLGKPLNAGIFIYKPSHNFNRECVKKIISEEITYVRKRKKRRN